MTNNSSLPVGAPLSFTGPWPDPIHNAMQGQWCTVVPLTPDHAQDLFDAYATETGDGNWTYLPVQKPGNVDAFRSQLVEFSTSRDPLFFAILDQNGSAVGFASYLRINPRDGTIEIGWISMSPRMQRSVVSSEAMFLMISHAMDDLGYRRCEWKCDSLNAPSRSAAERLGFTYEGTFRQATHYKGRSRDTAWFSIIDQEWAPIRNRFKAYLSPDNFTAGGQQIKRLAEF